MSREYPARPIVGVGIVVLRPGPDVLLVRRGKAPDLGRWALPGGAQDVGETAEAGARRELFEECGLTVGALHLVTNVDSIRHDAAGRVQYHYTILDFAGLWQGDVARHGDDVDAVEWAPVDGLAPYGLWQEAHRVIALAIRQLGLGA
jgi:8-oxo-dGTP diphosphatase